MAPIGLLGRIKRLQGQRVEGFRILVGGGSGHTPALGRQLHDFVPAKEVDEAVAWLVQEYRRVADNGDITFVDFIADEFSRLKEAFERRFGFAEETQAEKHGQAPVASAIGPTAA